MIAKKYEMLLFAFIMGAFMSGFMSLVVTFINIGFIDNFIYFWLNAYWKAFLIAFPTILFVIPRVRKIVDILIVK
ncbi:MAG: hypothetical protein COA66_15070 [Arcobacter sp.]|nr:MAG: hypothetical protein COA66_15070 [Arcobacter sp.]